MSGCPTDPATSFSTSAFNSLISAGRFDDAFALAEGFQRGSYMDLAQRYKMAGTSTSIAHINFSAFTDVFGP